MTILRLRSARHSAVLVLFGLGAALASPAHAAKVAPAAAAPATLTADQLIEHNVTARGGADRLAALSGVERHGRLVVPGMALQLGLAEWQGRGSHYRQEVSLQGLTAVTAYDGHEAWQIQPFEGRKDPSRMSQDEARDLAWRSDFEGPFVGYAAKGHRVEYLGMEEVDGTPAHGLRVQLKGGNEVTYWFDPDTWMVIRAIARETVRGAEDVTEVDFGEYKEVAGVYVAMTEEEGPKDSDPARRQKFVFDEVRANPTPAPTFYAFPQTAAPGAAGVHP